MLDNYLKTDMKTNLVETDLCIHTHAYMCVYKYKYTYWIALKKILNWQSMIKGKNFFLLSWFLLSKTKTKQENRLLSNKICILKWQFYISFKTEEIWRFVHAEGSLLRGRLLEELGKARNNLWNLYFYYGCCSI